MKRFIDGLLFFFFIFFFAPGCWLPLLLESYVSTEENKKHNDDVVSLVFLGCIGGVITWGFGIGILYLIGHFINRWIHG